MQYLIKRGVATIATVTPTGPQNKKIMADNTVTMTVQLSAKADFQINDYVDVFIADHIERYFLLDLADLEKASSRNFTYTITFKGWQYLLKKAAYRFPDADNNYTLSGLPLMGNLDTFIDLLIINANRDQSGWVKGTIDETDYQLITFNDNDNCLSVLATLSTAFNGIEWWVDGQTIHMTKKGVVEAVTYKYGQGNGLYDLKRTTSTDKGLVTRLYCYGSTKNIPADYKGFSDKLKLPGTTSFIEKNIWVNPADHSLGLKYGVIEDTIVFDDVYPHRTGLVTTVTDEFNFIDSAIDFDVNAQLLPGITAHIVFNTGQLAGYTFEISTFNNTTKSFKINANQDDKAFILPTSLIKPAVGDEYVIVDINMPSTYIAAAEAELLSRAQAYLDLYCNPIVSYAVTCDPINFKQRDLQLTLGNYVHITDTDLGIDADIRIIGFTRDLQIPSQYTMELADSTVLAPAVLAVVNNRNLVKTVARIGRTTNTAYNNALQAKATADGVKLITDFWGVTIDPDHGIIASGTLLVGAGPVGNAGITGVIDNIDITNPLHPIDRSVRIWAGADYEHKDTALFRVTDDGKMYASGAIISGEITATSGAIGQFDILDGILSSSVENSDGSFNSVLLGNNVIPATAPNLKATARIENHTPNEQLAHNGVNYGLVVVADGADKNIALDLTGGIVTDGQEGKTQSIDYDSGGGGEYTLFFQNVLYVGNQPKT